jgi:hypothetical protein
LEDARPHLFVYVFIASALVSTPSAFARGSRDYDERRHFCDAFGRIRARNVVAAG